MILNLWQHFLDRYTDVHFKSRKALAFSLIAFVVAVGFAIFVLSQPERISPFI